MKTSPVKGCLDYLPKEMELRQQVINKILEVYKNNGFLQVKTPILENLENLTSGDNGDNVKMMFKTVKRGAKLDLKKENLEEKDIVEEGLRYDLTVPLARLFTKYRNDLPYPFKSIQIEDSFRAEKPQEGRNRQFTQCDIDIWGESGIIGEIEIISTVMQAYKSIGLPNVLCRISNRKILNSIILNAGFDQDNTNEICIVIDKLDKIGAEGCLRELVQRGFDNIKSEALLSAIEKVVKQGVGQAVNFGVDAEQIQQMQELILTIRNLLPEGYNIEFDISIVRGQGYYTDYVFEMYCYESGYKGAIGGGGRYNNMYKKFAGVDVPAVGYGLGLDSVLLVLSKLGIQNIDNVNKLALIYSKDDNLNEVLSKKEQLKKEYNVSIMPIPKNFKELIRRLQFNGYGYLCRFSNGIIEQI